MNEQDTLPGLRKEITMSNYRIIECFNDEQSCDVWYKVQELGNDYEWRDAAIGMELWHDFMPGFYKGVNVAIFDNISKATAYVKAVIKLETDKAELAAKRAKHKFNDPIYF